jgi:hypothetical protein
VPSGCPARRLAGVGRRATRPALARREDDKKLPMLLATVAECAVEVIDELVQMFDQAISGTEDRARRKLNELLAAGEGFAERRTDDASGAFMLLPLMADVRDS